jgi:hypothetical protein
VVTLQVAENLLGRTADEGKESQPGTHLNHLPMRVAFEPLYMSASSSHKIVSSAKTVSSAGLFQMPTGARANLFIRSASAR